VLATRDQFLAVGIGTMYLGTLLMHRFAHNTRWDAWSPGSVMQMLMMRHLTEDKRVQRIDYGFGEPKLRLTNALDQRVTAVLFRKGFRNWSSIVAHSSYSSAVNMLKARLAGVALGFAACGEVARMVAPDLV
jgi:CelD/BcsL family acetyltransferase involved in cellulose biosynthesis